MAIEIGDTVKINHAGESYDGEICEVVRTAHAASFPYQVQMADNELYWMTEHDVALNGKKDPATARQLNYLRDLGCAVDYPISKSEASELIKAAIPRCHYCGQRASNTGFFGESVCRGCGG